MVSWGDVGKGLVSPLWMMRDRAAADRREDNEYAGIDRSNYDVPGFDERNARLNELERRYGQRVAPQSAGARLGAAAQSGVSDFRGQQGDLADQLRRRASGEESVSALQLRQALGQNLAQQQAMAASARPGQGGLAARTAAQQMAGMGVGLAGQQALAGMQEREGAQNLLGGLLGQARGQDVSQSQFNAGAQNQMDLARAQMQQQNQQFNVDALLRQLGLNDQSQLAALGLGLRNAGLQQGGSMGYEAERSRRFGAMLGVPTQGEQDLGMLQSLGQLAGRASGVPV